ncbi:hypothetical protein KMI_09g14500 [Encephalitozoon hellem]|nr:hypothetical protein KMI_09g14500 [Encephalitozoon hellem]
MGLGKEENNCRRLSDLDMEDLARRIDTFFSNRKTTNLMASSKKKVLQFAKSRGVNMNKSLIEVEEFPRNAYADELERFPVLKD